MMKKILIPIDFSEGSMNSCLYAINILHNFPARIHLYHIYNDQIMIPDSSFPSGLDTDAFFNSDVILAMKNEAEASMQTFASSLRKQIRDKQLNISVEHSLEGGDPEWEITGAIEELQPDIVIMGTSGHGKKGFLEGRMAQKIMNKASVPVLAVPENYSDFNIQNIMYPTNFNTLDQGSLKRLIHLLSEKNYVLHVCHFSPEKEDMKINDQMQLLEHHFVDEVKKGKMKFNILRTSNKIDALKTFTEYHAIDLIAFISEKKHLIKDLFQTHDFHKKDFFNLELPMLAINEEP